MLRMLRGLLLLGTDLFSSARLCCWACRRSSACRCWRSASSCSALSRACLSGSLAITDLNASSMTCKTPGI